MPFKNGQIANPNGRPKGSTNDPRRRFLQRLLVDPRIDRIFDRALKLAGDGNEKMIALIINKVLPNASWKDQIVSDFSELDFASGTIDDRCNRVLNYLTTGKLTLFEATVCMDLVTGRTKNLEAHGFEEILQKMSASMKNSIIVDGEKKVN